VNAAVTTWSTQERTGHDRPTFAAVAEENLDTVYRYLLLMTKDPTLAEDLTGETFERALRSWRRFDPRRAGARTWLCQIARSTALDHFRAEDRRRRREESYSRETPVAHEQPYGEGLSPALQQGLAELSAADREVIALRVVLDFDGESTARFLGISQTACSTRLSRALQKLEEKVRSNVVA
jgi:RNA polymerase sigma-70 factor (ECF subfamily)